MENFFKFKNTRTGREYTRDDIVGLVVKMPPAGNWTNIYSEDLEGVAGGHLKIIGFDAGKESGMTVADHLNAAKALIG